MIEFDHVGWIFSLKTTYFCLSAGYRLTLYTSDISIQEESLFFFNLKKKKEK